LGRYPIRMRPRRMRGNLPVPMVGRDRGLLRAVACLPPVCTPRRRRSLCIPPSPCQRVSRKNTHQAPSLALTSLPCRFEFFSASRLVLLDLMGAERHHRPPLVPADCSYIFCSRAVEACAKRCGLAPISSDHRRHAVRTASIASVCRRLLVVGHLSPPILQRLLHGVHGASTCCRAATARGLLVFSSAWSSASPTMRLICCFRQAAGRLDDDALFLAGFKVLRRDVQYAVPRRCRMRLRSLLPRGAGGLSWVETVRATCCRTPITLRPAHVDCPRARRLIVASRTSSPALVREVVFFSITLFMMRQFPRSP